MYERSSSSSFALASLKYHFMLCCGLLSRVTTPRPCQSTISRYACSVSLVFLSIPGMSRGIITRTCWFPEDPSNRTSLGICRPFAASIPNLCTPTCPAAQRSFAPLQKAFSPVHRSSHCFSSTPNSLVSHAASRPLIRSIRCRSRLSGRVATAHPTHLLLGSSSSSGSSMSVPSIW